MKSLTVPPVIAKPTAKEIAKILGMKLPAELARMMPEKPEPLPDGLGQGWTRQGLLHLPTA